MAIRDFWKRLWIPVVSLCVCTAACNESPVEPRPGPIAPPDVRQFVVGAAFTDLDGHGHFRLSTPPPSSPHPTITADRAREIALGVIRTWYANPDVVTLPGTISPVVAVQDQHGARIEWTRIQAGNRRPFVAHSALEPLPLSLGESAVRHYSPRYLVPLYVDDRPVVVVSVSMHATNVYFDEREFVRRPREGMSGGEWSVRGIPISLGPVTLPPSPEDAVRFAAEATGAKIKEVPLLGVPGNNVATTLARWELELDREIEFEQIVDGARVRTARIFVGAVVSFADSRLAGSAAPFGLWGLRLFVAAPVQPTLQQIRTEQVPIRSGYAVDLHQVRVLE